MRIIPNENSYIGFTKIRPKNLNAPTVAEITAATPLTGFIISITAQSMGNTVPTPNIDSLFETSVPGTSQASFTADMYRDDALDTAWDTLPRGTTGYFYISRFSGTGPGYAPAAGENVEVWPVRIVSRTASAMASNTAQTFTCTASVPEEPSEDAKVVAAAGPSAPSAPEGK
jgi:hypothetical protein